MRVHDGIVQGLKEAIAYNEGKIKLRTNTIEIEPVKNFGGEEIKSIRNNAGMTKALFAGLMGVSSKTIDDWENGKNRPNISARRIIEMLKYDHTFPEKMNIIKKS